MTLVNKIDSNITSLAIAEETSFKTLPGTPVWTPMEPNSYNDFGAQITTIPRNPITSGRQRKKGPVADLDAGGGFEMDLTQTNHQELLQGFFFADLRRKGEEVVTAVDVDSTNPDEYEVASTTGFLVGSLVKGSGFTNAANNALNAVTAVVADTSVEVADGQLVAEGSPPSDAMIVVVGHQAGSADLDVDITGDRPALTSSTLDFTTLGLIPGEFIFIGGDSATLRFGTSTNNGFARVRSIAANRLEFDKTQNTMANETGTGKTIQLFFGRVLKNEVDSLITRRTYQLERQLGAPDDASPSQIQSEYLTGSVANQLTLNIPRAAKVTSALGYVSADHESRTGATGVKSGTRPALVESDAFNTSSDFSRLKIAAVNEADANPTALFAFLTELTLGINNGITPNKAVTVLGAFDMSAGQFSVSGQMTAYFASVDAVAAVRNNTDVTLDTHLAKNNAGMSIDVPLIGLGDARLNVQQDQPITIPLATDAFSAAEIDANLNHTLLMVFYDYLPTLAES